MTYHSKNSQPGSSVDTVVTWEYDDYGRVTAEKRNGIKVAETVYGNDGAVLQSFDYINNTFHAYDYDVVGKLRRQYTWDTQTNSKLYEFEKIYDTAGRVAEIWYVIYTNGMPSPVKKYKYTYHKDNAPNINTLPNGSTITYTYDALRRPTKQAYKPTSSAASTVFLNTDLTYIAGTKAYTGTTTPLVSTFENKIGTGANRKDKYTYEYDAVGNIIKIIEYGYAKKPTATIAEESTKVINYKYDSFSRLEREDNEITNKTMEYAYDNGGNITNVMEYPYNNTTGNGTSMGSYTYSDTIWKDQLSEYNGQAIDYDNIGNPLNWQGNMTNLVWTNGRQLSSLNVDGTAVSYTYTPTGNRTSKTVGGVKTEYLLDGGLIMQQKTGEKTLNFYYDSAGQIVSMGYKLNASSPEVFYFVSRNAQGDIVSIYNSAGSTLVGTYTYDSWGKLVDPVVRPVGTTVSGGTGISLESSGSDPNGIMEMNPFRYRGYYYDTETKFYYLQSRYYDPEVKRFINADDRVSGVGEDVKGYNMYTYSNNNPVNEIDPEGTCSYNFLGYRVDCCSTACATSYKYVRPAAPSGVLTPLIPGSWVHPIVRQLNNTNLPKSEAAAIAQGYYKMSDEDSKFHKTVTKWGAPNSKYVSQDGKKEIVFFSDGTVNDDPRDYGSYNYCPMYVNGKNAGLFAMIGHGIVDIAPAFLFG